MSVIRDPDRILRAWLDLMPDEAPDHVIADVLEAIDAMPRTRSSRRWSPRRTSMNRSLAALAAAVLVVVVAATLVLRTTGQSSVGSSALPPGP